jgi:hypothetical protein
MSPIALDPRLDRQFGLQCVDGVAGLALLPEADRGVCNQQHQDDEEVGPVLHYARQNDGDLDHPGNRAPKIEQEFEKRVGLLLCDLVWSVLDQALRCLRLAQAVRRRSQLLLDGR